MISDKCSYFIEDRALFGSYPTQSEVTELETMNVKYFINLVDDTESKIVPYTTNYTQICYVIPDHYVPGDSISFSKFILNLRRLLLGSMDDKMYIHCKGGHGRSGIVVACISCICFNLSPVEALTYTGVCHGKRTVMRHKWRLLGSPQTRLQKNFVLFICRLHIVHVSDLEAITDMSYGDLDHANLVTLIHKHSHSKFTDIIYHAYTTSSKFRQWVDNTYLRKLMYTGSDKSIEYFIKTINSYKLDLLSLD